jgi:hypothetical protein
MVESHDDLIMEIADEIGLNCMVEDSKDEDDDDGGDATTPPAPVPPTAAREVTVIKEEDPVEMVPEQEALGAHEVIVADAEPEPL